MRVDPSEDALVVAVESERETERLGHALAGELVPGDVVGLVGPLGAGKTRLVRAIAEALGVDPRSISSPTFGLIHEYPGTVPIYHFDTYRLDSPEAFDDLGAEEYWSAGGICLVEWADRVADRLPPDAWRITIAIEGEGRTFTMDVRDAARTARLTAMLGPDLNSGGIVRPGSP